MIATNRYLNLLRIVILAALALIVGVANAKTRVVFLNGITNEKADAYLSQVRLEEVIREYWASKQLDTKEIVVKHWHNPTGGFVADNVEMLVLGTNTDKADQCAKAASGTGTEYKKMYRACLGALYKNSFESQNFVGDSESAKVYSTLKALTEYIETVLDQNEKIIIVAHSQGNYFAEALHAYMGTRSKAAIFDSNVRFVGVASVAPSSPNDKYITLKQDLALSAWNGAKAVQKLVLPILTRNLDACEGDQGCPLRLQGIDKAVHNFVKIYLSNTSESLPFPLKKYVSDLVRDAYRALNEAQPPIITTPLYEQRYTSGSGEQCYDRGIGTAKSAGVYTLSNTTYCLRGGKWVDATGVDNERFIDSQGNLYPFSSVEIKDAGNNTYTAGYGGSTIWNMTFTQKSAGVYSQSIKSVADSYSVHFDPNSYIYQNVDALVKLLYNYNTSSTNTGYLSSGGTTGFLFVGANTNSGTVKYFNINDPNRFSTATGTWTRKTMGSNTDIIELDEKSTMLNDGDAYMRKIYYKNSSESGVREGNKSVAGQTNTMEVFDRTTFNAMLARDGLPATPN